MTLVTKSHDVGLDQLQVRVCLDLGDVMHVRRWLDCAVNTHGMLAEIPFAPLLPLAIISTHR